MPLSDPWLPVPDPDTGEISPAKRFIPLEVYRLYDPEDSGQGGDLMTNVSVLEIDDGLGDTPSRCRLKYILDSTDPAAPASIEDALSDLSEKTRVLLPGDRVVVWGTRPDGVREPLFDGFVLSFEGHLARSAEAVTMLCAGVEVRLDDTPMPGAIWRDEDFPRVPGHDGTDDAGNPIKIGNDHATDETAYFNPRGKANCCPDGSPAGAAWHVPTPAKKNDQKYPVFVDPTTYAATDADLPTDWTLSKFARYAIYSSNTEEKLVTNPDGKDLDDLLVAKEPIDGVMFNPRDPSTYTVKPIVVADKPGTGKSWRRLLNHVIGDKGFTQRIGLYDPGDGSTRNDLILLAPDESDIVDLWLQPRGRQLDLRETNLGAASVGRDLTGVVNRWEVRGEFNETELSVVLQCGSPMDPADANNLDQFRTTSPTYTAAGMTSTFNAYRLFLFDEAGDGHYQPGGSSPNYTVPSLDAVFGGPINGVPQYAKRRRVPIADLVTKDGLGRPYKARLSISTDYYPGGVPGVWDPAATYHGSPAGGTWRAVHGGYRVLKDRIGIYVTDADPNGWNIGREDATGAPFGQGIVKIVECLNSAHGNVPFYLRLTFVIREDKRIVGEVTRKLNAVLPWTVTRQVDAHERYKFQRVLKNSEFNATSSDVIARDDTAAAVAESVAMQMATQDGVLGGTVTIPWITRSYIPGDQVRSIQGRNLGFRTDDGEGHDSVPTYPIVLRRRWRNTPVGQVTELELSDANMARRSYLKSASPRSGSAPSSPSTRG